MSQPQRKRSRYEPLGQIEKLVLENFKSYEGVREIGPFHKFTCVIGPNGSGKSNVMDAISFCLGIRAKHLRSDKLKDLVHRKEKEKSSTNTRTARVEIHFRTSEGILMRFGRCIDAKGVGTYRCGPEDRVENVTYEKFLAELASHGIMVKARNFLVFQGDVMELARQQGEHLRNVLESLSGSDKLKEEYTTLSHQLDATQEKARMHFQHLQELKGTVALLEKQRAEVEKYNELRARILHLEVEMFLFTLYCGELEANRHRSELAKLRADLQQLDAEMKSRRRNMEEFEKQSQELKSKQSESNTRLFVLGSNLEQMKPEINSGNKKLQHYRSKVKQTQVLMQAEEQKHKLTEVQLVQIRDDRAHAERALAKKRAEASEELLVNLTDKQRREYNEASEKTDLLNVRTREQIRETDEELAILSRELEADRQDLKALTEKRDKIESKLEEHDATKMGLDHDISQENEELESKKSKLARLQANMEEYQRFNSALSTEMQLLVKKLDQAQGRREKLEMVEQKQRIADELRNAFPDGVIGRVSELILPTQRRFDLPVQMCMGKFPDAFIVTDAKTGFACSRYMKDKRIKQEDFLLMDRIQVPHVGPTHLLTQNSSNRHLATMCVQHNDKFLERHPRWQATGPAYIDKVVKHLLSSSVIVDEIQDAKRCAYVDARKHNLRPRVVTLDGEVIAANGNMSVQQISAHNRVEFGGAEEIVEIRRQESKLEQVRQDRAELEDKHRKDLEDERDLEEQIRTIEGRKANYRDRLKRMNEDHSAEQKLLIAWRSRSEELAGKVKRNMSTVENLNVKKERLESELLKVGKKYFARLSQELGVEDVREIMKKEEVLRRNKQKERQELEDFIFNATSEEQELLRKLQVQSRMTSLKESHQQYLQEATREEDRLKTLEGKFHEAKDQHERELTEARALNIKKERLEEVLKNDKAEMVRCHGQVGEAKKKVKKTGDLLKIVLITICTHLRECQEKQVELPFLSKDEVKMELILSREKELEDIPRDDLESACLAIQLDFSRLPEEKKDIAKQTAVFDSKHVQLEYQNAMKVLQIERDQLNPNMQSLEQCNIENEKLQEVKAKAEEAAEQSKKLEVDFDKVKTERTKCFMDCFKFIESKVNPIYKLLTTYDTGEGGSAYLDLDDPEEPYRGGITFTACPPGKRFFPMNQLSGGEKSMASMALLFAMHSYRPPPFMILDEVDAPFDKKNTNSLVAYCKRLHFQCIVISLKDTFFSHSDGIIGICKDLRAETSLSMTLHLNRLMSTISAPPKVFKHTAPLSPALDPVLDGGYTSRKRSVDEDEHLAEPVTPASPILQ